MEGKIKICKCCGRCYIEKRRNKYLYRYKYCSSKCLKKMDVILIRERQKELVKISREIGNCTRCGKERGNKKYTHCSKCRSHQRDYERKYQKKISKLKNKKCLICGKILNYRTKGELCIRHFKRIRIRPNEKIERNIK